jgi:hypothetical protein
MVGNNGRSIRRREREGSVAGNHDDHATWQASGWLVPFLDGRAVIHHAYGGCDEHALCGPLVFCCHSAMDLFLLTYPKSELAGVVGEILPSDQIVSWMDAGIQAIYFVYCAPEMPSGLAASGMSGNQAREALDKQAPFGKHFIKSSQILDQIAWGNSQARCEIGADTLPILSLRASSQ